MIVSIQHAQITVVIVVLVVILVVDFFVRMEAPVKLDHSVVPVEVLPPGAIREPMTSAQVDRVATVHCEQVTGFARWASALVGSY
jgi:hypothetical protein